MTKTFAFAAAALAAIASPAIAADAPTASIDITDLDLNKKVDQQRLDQRIDTTARRICRTDSFDAASRKLERQCKAAVKADAAPKVELAIASARTERFATIDLDVQG